MDQAQLAQDSTATATATATMARVGGWDDDDSSDGAKSPTYYDDSELDMIKADEALQAPVAGQARKKVSRRKRSFGCESDDSADEDYMPTTAKGLFVCLDVPPRPVRKCRRRGE